MRRSPLGRYLYNAQLSPSFSSTTDLPEHYSITTSSSYLYFPDYPNITINILQIKNTQKQLTHISPKPNQDAFPTQTRSNPCPFWLCHRIARPRSPEHLSSSDMHRRRRPGQIHRRFPKTYTGPPDNWRLYREWRRFPYQVFHFLPGNDCDRRDRPKPRQNRRGRPIGIGVLHNDQVHHRRCECPVPEGALEVRPGHLPLDVGGQGPAVGQA